MCDLEVRHAEELAAATSPSRQLQGHAHSADAAALQVESARVAQLKEALRGVKEAAATQSQKATTALSGMFGRLARERALHEREMQHLQQNVSDLSHELAARRACDKHMDAQVMNGEIRDDSIFEHKVML